MTTNTNETLYLFDKLKRGEHLHIVFMSHNAYWAQVEILSDRFENCKVQILGRGTAYIEMAKFSKWYEPIDECDLIVLRETEYSEYEFTKMKNLAQEISKAKNKHVTIGYSYHSSEGHFIKFAKVNNEEIIEDYVTISDYPHPIDLINATLIIHDNQEYKFKKRI